MRLIHTTLIITALAITPLFTYASNSKKAIAWTPPSDILYGTPPSKNVKNWVRLNMLGVIDAVSPIIWISPQKFSRNAPEVLIQLPMDKYLMVVNYVRSNKCKIKKYDYKTMGQALQATEYLHGKTLVRCVLPQPKGCSYLDKLVSLQGLSLTADNLDMIDILKNGLWCEGGRHAEWGAQIFEST